MVRVVGRRVEGLSRSYHAIKRMQMDKAKQKLPHNQQPPQRQQQQHKAQGAGQGVGQGAGQRRGQPLKMDVRHRTPIATNAPGGSAGGGGRAQSRGNSSGGVGGSGQRDEAAEARKRAQGVEALFATRTASASSEGSGGGILQRRDGAAVRSNAGATDERADYDRGGGGGGGGSGGVAAEEKRRKENPFKDIPFPTPDDLRAPEHWSRGRITELLPSWKSAYTRELRRMMRWLDALQQASQGQRHPSSAIDYLPSTAGF